MNRMSQMLRAAQVGLVIAAVLAGLVGGGLRGGNVAAASGSQQWTGPYSDNCFYYGTSTASTAAACLTAYGELKFWSPDQYGQWVHVATIGRASDGSLSLWYLGLERDTLYPASTTLGQPTYRLLTGNPMLDQLLIAANSAMNSRTLAPTCLFVAHNTCYYY